MSRVNVDRCSLTGISSRRKEARLHYLHRSRTASQGVVVAGSWPRAVPLAEGTLPSLGTEPAPVWCWARSTQIPIRVQDALQILQLGKQQIRQTAGRGICTTCPQTNIFECALSAIQWPARPREPCPLQEATSLQLLCAAWRLTDADATRLQDADVSNKPFSTSARGH